MRVNRVSEDGTQSQMFLNLEQSLGHMLITEKKEDGTTQESVVVTYPFVTKQYREAPKLDNGKPQVLKSTKEMIKAGYGEYFVVAVRLTEELPYSITITEPESVEWYKENYSTSKPKNASKGSKPKSEPAA